MIALNGVSLVVVGGAAGIGRAAAAAAVELGAEVTVADVARAEVARAEVARAEVARAEVAGAAYVECDATDAGQVAKALDAVPRLDALITTVGGAHLDPIEDVDPQAWDDEIRFNLTSAYNVCRSAIARMRAAGGGSLVTFSSGYAGLPAPDRPGYSAAKAGVISLTRSLAVAAAPDGVRVNCVAPGPTLTERFRAMNGGDAGVERVRASMPLGRIPTPEDVAAMAVFLVSGAARAITGQVIHVNGGAYLP